MEVGLRVVRGPNWKYGDQDDGEGHVGTVVAIGTTLIRENSVDVLWDSGERNNYRTGAEGAYDLRIFDTAPIGVNHLHVTCDICKIHDMYGMRWKCMVCDDFDLCTPCYMSDKHDLTHKFRRFDVRYSCGVILPERQGAFKVQSKGIFVGAKVVRGEDWRWANQHGGGSGIVYEIKAWKDDGDRDAASVTWEAGTSNMYRRGFGGKVDLKYVAASDGGEYYPNHLPVLDERVFTINTSMSSLRSENFFEDGDVVEICNCVELVKALQDGHGGWSERVKHAIGMRGEVGVKDVECLVHVSFDSHELYFNPLSISDVFCPSISNTDGDDDSGTDVLNKDSLVGTFSVEPGDKEMDVFIKNADASLDIPDALNGILQYGLTTLENGRSLLHVACKHGCMKMVHLILAASGKDIEIPDSNGDRPLHYAVYNNRAHTAYYLIKQGANKDVINSDGCSPLHMAVKGYSLDSVKILIENGCSINVQDSCGNTALHYAVGECLLEIVDLFINAPDIDLSLKNENRFNVLHHAAVDGNASITEKLILKSKELVNSVKGDGNTALHIAAANGHYGVADILLWQGFSVIDVFNNFRQTPLMLAVSRCHCNIVELLVSFGANVNASDENGNTAMHLALMAQNTEGARDLVNAPNIAEILSQLASIDSNRNYGLAIACYLATHGASASRCNKEDKIPFHLTLSKESHRMLSECCSKYDPEEMNLSYEASHDLRTQCMICSEALGTVTFYPCGHCVTCEPCCIRVRKCIVCQKFIERKTVGDREITSEDCQLDLQRMRQLQIEIEGLRDDQTCTICLERRRNVAFTCGHSVCSVCSEELRSCHMCRKPIEMKINLY